MTTAPLIFAWCGGVVSLLTLLALLGRAIALLGRVVQLVPVVAEIQHTQSMHGRQIRKLRRHYRRLSTSDTERTDSPCPSRPHRSR